MRQKKIRGHKRRWNDIEKWRLRNLEFNLAGYLINQNDRYYAKISVHPWSGLALTNSAVPHPSGKTKQKMLSALLDIYEDWKNQLDKLGRPYYLKVWLFEPRFSQSQVVCAIGDDIDFYDQIFFKPEKAESLNAEKYGSLKSRLENFSWDHRLDEDHYENTEVGEPGIYSSRKEFEDEIKWFENLLKKPHRTYTFKEPIGEATESYSFKRGDVWIGGKK